MTGAAGVAQGLPGSGFAVWDTRRTWRLARLLLHVPLRHGQRYRIYGGDRVPADGPVVLAANHVSGWDIFALGVSVPRPIYYMAKHELFGIPVVRRILPHTGAFPVRRGEPDREAVRTARAVLAAGHQLGVFVEGGRQDPSDIGAARTGAAMLAATSGVPVVCACLHGTERQTANPLHPATVAFGAPFRIDGRGARAYRTGAARIEDELRALRRFVHSAERVGRPRVARPPHPGGTP